MRRSLHIQRAFNGKGPAIEDVGIDHGSFHIFVTEKFLDGTDVVMGLQQVGGEGMAKGVRADGLGNARGFSGSADGLLQAAFIKVVTAEHFPARIPGDPFRGEHILPAPFLASIGVLALQRVGQKDAAVTVSQILFMQGAAMGELIPESRNDTLRQHRHAILRPLAIAHGNLVEFEIHIFDAQAETFHQAQTAAVKQARHEQMDTGHLRQDPLHFGPGQHGGQTFGLLRADSIEIQGIEFLVQHLAVEKEQRATRLRAAPESG